MLLTLPSHYTLKAFSGTFQSESSKHNPGTSRHRGNWGGNSPRIFDFVTRIWVRISRKPARILFWKVAWILRGSFFSPFVPVPEIPRQIHATPNPQIHADFANFFPNGFSWGLTLALGTFKQGVSKQGVTTFAWQPGSQYDVAATGADNVLASDCRAQFGCPSTRRRSHCVTVRLPV